MLGAWAWGEGSLAPTDRDPDPGPDAWQIWVLECIKEKHFTVEEALQLAVASGHGIGKSALIAWIILWFICCKPHCNGVVTANTQQQLTGKTWREVGVWLGRMRSMYANDFVMTATKLYHRDHERTWFISAIPWSEKNPEAFAGLHAQWVIVLFDEGSAIPKVIWETVMGALTTPHAMWIVFGNPTRNSGKFYDCFHRDRHRWERLQVDSRTAKKVLRSKVQQWVDDYGEDSDFVRVRVRGVFPRAGMAQFIPNDLAEDAQRRWKQYGIIAHNDNTCPVIFGAVLLGVDVARFGDDATTIWLRVGHYARCLARHYGKDTMAVAGYIAEFIDQIDPDMVFIDAVGVGAGVFDRLVQLGYGTRLMPVVGSQKAQDEKQYHNKRAENWGRMKEWLKAGGCVEDDQVVLDDLTGLEYFFDMHQRYQLESKDDLKERGLPSPDNADALAQTFDSTVAPRDREPVQEDRYARDRSGGGSGWAA